MSATPTLLDLLAASAALKAELDAFHARFRHQLRLDAELGRTVQGAMQDLPPKVPLALAEDALTVQDKLDVLELLTEGTSAVDIARHLRLSKLALHDFIDLEPELVAQAICQSLK